MTTVLLISKTAVVFFPSQVLEITFLFIFFILAYACLTTRLAEVTGIRNNALLMPFSCFLEDCKVEIMKLSHTCLMKVPKCISHSGTIQSVKNFVC